MDDFCTWEQQRDQAEKLEVLRHFVGNKIRATGQGLDPMHIVAREFGAGLLAEKDHALRVSPGLTMGIGQANGEVPDIRQFSAAEDLGMAVEDLLYEGGTGARHTDNKDQLIGPVGGARRTAHEIRTKGFHDGIHMSGVGLVVKGTARHAVAQSGMVKGATIVTGGIEQSGQLEMQRNQDIRIAGQVMAPQLILQQFDRLRAQPIPSRHPVSPGPHPAAV